MYRFSALVGGLVAGAIGAGIWAVIAYFTGFELGWIAWGVGLLVGVGVIGPRRRACGGAGDSVRGRRKVRDGQDGHTR
jgi:hypothetical protein